MSAMTPKPELPQGALRLIRDCDDGTRSLTAGELNVAKVLAGRDYLEFLGGGDGFAFYRATAKGRDAVRKWWTP